jgi:hypothetical protein
MQIEHKFLGTLEDVSKRVWCVECTLDTANPAEAMIRNALYRARIEINTAEHLAKVQLGLREV